MHQAAAEKASAKLRSGNFGHCFFEGLDHEISAHRATMKRLRALAKLTAGFLFGEYSIYRIYRFRREDLAKAPSLADGIRFTELTAEDIETSRDEGIPSLAHYLNGKENRAFGLLRGNDIVAVIFFWYGETYRTRNFWPLRDDEAKSVHMFTAPEMRGKGLAGSLKVLASEAMFDAGFNQIYSRVWHSNKPSIRANEKIGARHVATVIELNPLRRRKPWRFEIHKKFGLKVAPS